MTVCGLSLRQVSTESHKTLEQKFLFQIGHFSYINILTWLRGFRVKLLYLVLFSLYSSLFWELRDKRNFKKFTILTRKLRSHVAILIYRTWPIGILNPDGINERFSFN